MRKRVLKQFGIVFVLFLVGFFVATPSQFFGENSFSKKLSELQITLGLDLAGGTELDYKIDLSDAIAQNNDEDPTNDVNLDVISESVREALEKRVNPAGVGEIIIKRSQINKEEHILVQMPPSSNVEKAKNEAEQDNRLEFFAENPNKEDEETTKLEEKIAGLNSYNWTEKTTEWKTEENTYYQNYPDPIGIDGFSDKEFAEKVFALNKGGVLSTLEKTQTELDYVVGEDGNLQVKNLPKSVVAIVKVNNKTTETVTNELPDEVQARHILFAFPESERADENVKYASKDEAKTEAEKMLAKLNTEGTTDFENLAKEFSTESAAQESGGDLGKFSRGRMVPAFEDAVWELAKKGLVPKVIETQFGFHVIEVLDFQTNRTETKEVEKIAYEIFGWENDEFSWEKTELGGAQLQKASVGFDQIGKPYVGLLFNDEGGDMFGDLTELVASRKCDNDFCRLGIKVGGNWYTQATVREKILGREAQISGNFTFESAKELANGLNLGAIDAPVILSGQTTILPELGEEQLNKSVKAAALGFLATILFMIFSYRLAGIVAGVSLIMYAGLFITILKLSSTSIGAQFGGPFVLSLSGMAGMALSIGLAVDGNILIFERMKEELNREKSLTESVELGFNRAWSAIKDSNMTTLITCLILFIMGSSIIRGFAITLIIGTLLSMFTAVFVSRTLLRLMINSQIFKNKKLWKF